MSRRKRQFSYADWSLDALRKAFALQMIRQDLFPATVTEPIVPALWLQEILQRGQHLALASEKARSEFIIAPILLFISDLLEKNITVYSGVRFDVDKEKGLHGICDFILSRSPALPTVQAPVFMLVEAKKNDIEEGLGQCAAEMVAAQWFNQQENTPIATVYGCVTTGETWQFMALQENTLCMDDRKYFITDLTLILNRLKQSLAV
ncbi:hypothetical protein [Thioflexithrix psekupsensis]|uniref:Uncharacterized protein n=1 Tax=Thioflexithrix psekupsensis TaxID=1570016 RepID=A0A251X6S5_9GAMM|nr:hypothetical protein [Thioflexithrix psekupsensis]OUD13778.1 hypothetical protein TPSD3_05345 [Thioflexithrix psekupsensis]